MHKSDILTPKNIVNVHDLHIRYNQVICER